MKLFVFVAFLVVSSSLNQGTCGSWMVCNGVLIWVETEVVTYNGDPLGGAFGFGEWESNLPPDPGNPPTPCTPDQPNGAHIAFNAMSTGPNGYTTESFEYGVWGNWFQVVGQLVHPEGWVLTNPKLEFLDRNGVWRPGSNVQQTETPGFCTNLVGNFETNEVIEEYGLVIKFKVSGTYTCPTLPAERHSEIIELEMLPENGYRLRHKSTNNLPSASVLLYTKNYFGPFTYAYQETNTWTTNWSLSTGIGSQHLAYFALTAGLNLQETRTIQEGFTIQAPEYPCRLFRIENKKEEKWELCTINWTGSASNDIVDMLTIEPPLIPEHTFEGI